VPDGATVLANANGTAPGLAIVMPSNPFQPGKLALLIMLPGPPRELRPMFEKQAIPLIEKTFPLESAFIWRVLRTTGLGESLVEEKIAAPLSGLVAAGL